MIFTRRGALAALAMSTSLGFAPYGALAQNAEKPNVTLGVGGKQLLYYLPLTVAEKKGFFKEQGLDVTINDFGGGAKSLQALIGGSVDIVTGAYEHTIRMQAKGQDIRAVVELGRFPAITIAVRKELADKVKSAADFKGLKIGVTAPGSSTALTAQYAMVKAGLEGDGRADHRRRCRRERRCRDQAGPGRHHLASRPRDLEARSRWRRRRTDRHPHRGRHQGAVRRLEPCRRALSQERFRREEPGHDAEARQRAASSP